MARKPSSACANAPWIEESVPKFVLSPEAVDDLDLICSYIAQDNPEAADRVLEAACDLCKILADHPELGRLRRFAPKELSDLRSFVITEFPNYVIFYRAMADGVQIVRVLHGARDIGRIFGE